MCACTGGKGNPLPRVLGPAWLRTKGEPPPSLRFQGKYWALARPQVTRHRDSSGVLLRQRLWPISGCSPGEQAPQLSRAMASGQLAAGGRMQTGLCSAPEGRRGRAELTKSRVPMAPPLLRALGPRSTCTASTRGAVSHRPGEQCHAGHGSDVQEGARRLWGGHTSTTQCPATNSGSMLPSDTPTLSSQQPTLHARLPCSCQEQPAPQGSPLLG